MDLFGMYGSRDDGESEAEQGRPDERERSGVDPLADTVESDFRDDDQDYQRDYGYDRGDDGDRPRDDDRRRAYDRATHRRRPAPPPVPSRQEEEPLSARDEQVARYIEELGVIDEQRHLVRPYTTTGGRTRADVDLGLETMIVVTRPTPQANRQEHRKVIGICVNPTSVAEVAAHTRLPIGAARVVIGDMIDLGLVVICSSPSTGHDPSVDLMSRVLAGLQRL